MGTTTTNLELYKPANGETGWGNLVSASFDIIDIAHANVTADLYTEHNSDGTHKGIQINAAIASGIAANTIVVDHNAGTGRIISRGVNATTVGSIDVIIQESDGGGSLTPLSISSNGTVTLLKLAGTGLIVQSIEGTPYTSKITTQSFIPLDDTIPQITEGLELVGDATITPRSASNRLKITAVVPMVATGASASIIGAIFQGDTPDAIAVSCISTAANGQIMPLSFYHECSAGNTTARTYHLRVASNGNICYINQGVGGSGLGGTAFARLRVEEIGA